MLRELDRQPGRSVLRGSLPPCVVLCLALQLVPACATTPDQRINSAVQMLNRTLLVDRLETLSASADDLLVVKEFFERLDDVATVCKSLRVALDAETLDWIMSKVSIVKVAWGLLDSLDVMKQFWRSIQELKTVPAELRAAMTQAQKEPSEANMSRLAQACASARKTLGGTLRVASMVKLWVSSATFAMAIAQAELRSLEKEYDGWGASLVIKGIEELLPMLGNKVIAAAGRELTNLEEQLQQDIQILEDAQRLLKPDV